MSGGKKKKSSSPSDSKSKKASSAVKESVTSNIGVGEKREVKVEGKGGGVLDVDVLDRLAPPILFFPPNVSEEYLNRFCPDSSAIMTGSTPGLLADEGFPDREIPVMRRLLAMMAGIMSKASSASARAYYSRVAGAEGRRNGYFQQNLNTSVFNLFSTLSAAGNVSGDLSAPSSADLHLTPPAAFTAKDGDPLRGYPQRLMKFWRQLSAEEQVRLVKEEHAALTNSWIESRKSWCLCAHCKHRRMTISDLTDCLYQTYCEELEAFMTSGGHGSTLYSANLTNSMEPAARARRFLFKSLSVVGEQALLPRYNQFIMRLEAFSSMAFNLKYPGVPQQSKSGGKQPSVNSNSNSNANANGSTVKNGGSPLASLKPSSLKSAALQASKEFLQKHGRNPTLGDINEEMSISIQELPIEFKGLNFKIMHDSDDEINFVKESRIRRNHNYDDDEDDSEYDDDDDEDEGGDKESHQGGIQSEDDDDLIDEETDLPVDESELMLPGGSSFPLLPIGDGPVQWSESSRIECGRTVFLMFASEMFQYRLTAAYLTHQTRVRQMKLIAEVEEEERLEKEMRLKEERERKERVELEKKRKAAKKEKAAAKANGTKNKTSTAPTKLPIVTKPTLITETVVFAEAVEATETLVVPETVVTQTTVTEESELPQVIPPTLAFEPIPSIFDFSTPIIPSKDLNSEGTAPVPHDDDDDFDPTELVERLAKEMNRFELNSTLMASDGGVTSPPGFAPPPGFDPVSPKHLAPEDANRFHYPHPPFAFDQGNYNHGMQYSRPPPMYPHYHHPHQQYSYPNDYYGNYPIYNYPPPPPMGYPPNYGYTQQAPPPSAPPLPLPLPSSTPTPFNPFERKEDPTTPDEERESRFQSFFSKSIFGPSSFFSNK